MKKLFLLTYVLFLISCSDDEPVVADSSEVFVDNWLITRVILDGDIQPEWANKTISFEQADEESGIYLMSETPNDSIFAKSGIWKSSDMASMFIREDSIYVFFSIVENKLTLNQELIWSAEQCPELPCITVPSGNWIFELVKTDD